MDKKSTKKIKKTDLSVTVLLVIGILVVVNFFSNQLFARWDLTENKIFSVSPATKRVLKELDDIVSVKAYFSSTLPSQVLATKQEVSDVLSEYQTYSGGKVKVEFIDPKDDQAVERELAMIGIPQLTFQVYDKDQMQLVNGYMGIAISFGGNTEVIPAVKSDTSDLEYQLTTAVKKVTSDKIANIGYLTSQGTVSLDDEMKAAQQALQELYSVVNVELTEDNPSIPATVDTLLIVGPTEKFTDAELQAINSFVARGGALLVLSDGVTVGQGLTTSKNPTGLEELLGKYGITLNQDLVADRRSGVASFSQGYFTFSSNYPFWPLINQDGFNSANSAVSTLENVVLPWASSIDIDTSKINADSFQYLAFTTDQGWHVTDNFNIAPNATLTPQGDKKNYNLAVSVNGSVPNAYPEDGGEDTINARIIVVGDSEFPTDNFIRQNPDNLTLFQNLVDSLSLDEDLITIRSKGVTSRPINDLSDSTKMSIRYFNVFGITLVVIAFGLIRYFLRRRSRFVDDL